MNQNQHLSAPVSQSQESRYSIRAVFRKTFIIYMVTNVLTIILLMLFKKIWLVAAIILGSIFVFISMEHFYENVLVPYIHEKTRVLPARPSIRTWLSEWIFPAVSIQFFVIFGLYIALAINPFNHSMYANAFMYGKLYKEWTGNDDKWRRDHLIKYSEYINESRVDRSQDTVALNYIKRFFGWSGRFVGIGKTQQDLNGKVGPETSITVGSATAANKTILYNKTDELIHRIPFQIAFSFGFLGALIYCLKDIVFRSFTEDLYSSTLSSYIIRIIVAPILCIVVAHFRSNDWWSDLGPLVFFSIGFFPQRAMEFMEEKMVGALGLKSDKVKDEMPLNLIQGMNDYIICRFKEIGITDIQNLACANLCDVCKKIGYCRRMLCDFVSQAIFLVHLKEHSGRLKSFGIRDLFSFQAIVTEANCCKFASRSQVDPEALKGFLAYIKSPEMVERISNIKSFLGECNSIEQHTMQQEGCGQPVRSIDWKVTEICSAATSSSPE